MAREAHTIVGDEEITLVDMNEVIAISTTSDGGVHVMFRNGGTLSVKYEDSDDCLIQWEKLRGAFSQ